MKADAELLEMLRNLEKELNELINELTEFFKVVEKLSSDVVLHRVDIKRMYEAYMEGDKSAFAEKLYEVIIKSYDMSRRAYGIIDKLEKLKQVLKKLKESYTKLWVITEGLETKKE